ncbi:hypothetical protein ABW20_dc0106476 [Dactylellina cionopaga]|nr:hypothetical protein ABW20_dc0106476 [Dactylellina cionopaga]
MDAMGAMDAMVTMEPTAVMVVMVTTESTEATEAMETTEIMDAMAAMAAMVTRAVMVETEETGKIMGTGMGIKKQRIKKQRTKKLGTKKLVTEEMEGKRVMEAMEERLEIITATEDKAKKMLMMKNSQLTILQPILQSWHGTYGTDVETS